MCSQKLKFQFKKFAFKYDLPICKERKRKKKYHSIETDSISATERCYLLPLYLSPFAIVPQNIREPQA